MSTNVRRDTSIPVKSRAGRLAGAPIRFVRANALAPFVALLNTIGTPVDRLLNQASIPQPLLNDSEALLPLFSSYRFAELAARQEKMEDLGVIVGQRACAFDLGTYGAVLQQASTVYEYMETGVQLIGQHSSGTRLWLTNEGERLRVTQHLAGPPSIGRCIADLYTLVITISTLRKMIGPDWSPGEVRLLAGDEAMVGGPHVFGDAPLITGQRYSSFTVSRSLTQLLVPCQSTKTSVGQHTEPAAGQWIPEDFKTSAEQLVASLLLDGYPSIQTAADASGMSSRTLQRRLAEVGMSYSALVASSRLRMAKAWLTESDIPIAEIATTLGYHEPSNFTRAFRRQTGISPAAYRRNQRQD